MAWFGNTLRNFIRTWFPSVATDVCCHLCMDTLVCRRERYISKQRPNQARESMVVFLSRFCIVEYHHHLLGDQYSTHCRFLCHICQCSPDGYGDDVGAYYTTQITFPFFIFSPRFILDFV